MNRIRNRHFFLLDVALLWLAVYASFVLRLERLHLGEFSPAFVLFGITAVFATTFAFYRLGVYARYWRYASVDELVLLTVSVGIATTAASLFSFVVLHLLPPDWILPRSIPAIFFMLALGATAVPRFAVRSYVRYQYRLHRFPPGKNVLIAGAGDAGAMIAREMQRNPHLGMIPVGFVD
ncbi:MAG: polysaccharide biosynthesis protein, partial [Anaerolineae bacterium]|nr:polysaccharide biosynthesis protein [Anaerolineae bacterium]